MILLYKYISHISLLHYSYRKCKKLLQQYAYKEKSNQEQRKEIMEGIISRIKCTER